MKGYSKNDDNNNCLNNVKEEINNEKSGAANKFGLLALVDHMNDVRGYQMWLHETTHQAGCDNTFIKEAKEFRRYRQILMW